MTNSDNVWTVQLFDAVVVISPDGVRTSLGASKAAELLAFVALNFPQSLHRKKIITALWGDADLSSSRTRLRQEIMKIRNLFPDAATTHPFLEIGTDEICLRPDVTVDANRFRDAANHARNCTDWAEAQQWVAIARSLYRPGFLSEFSSLWAISENSRFTRLYQLMLRDFADLSRRNLNYEAAEEALQALVDHSPLQEEDHVSLMRLYAEIGQPARIQQQYHTLEKVLRESAMPPPTSSTLRMVNQLREGAGGQLSLAAKAETQTQPANSALFITTVSTDTTSQPTVHQQPAFRNLVCGALAVAATVSVLGAVYLRSTRPGTHAATRQPSPRGQEKWVFTDTPQVGEKPNSEGKAIAADVHAIYVTGLIETEHDDSDILTVKITHEGKHLWRQRYSSPEHDCDRAFSLSLSHTGQLYVGGESYIPDKPGVRGGWRLTILNYDQNSGRLNWVRRSQLEVHNEEHRVQVLSDDSGGCYLVGTSIANGVHHILVERYTAKGDLAWAQTLADMAGARFCQAALTTDGRLIICGLARREADGGTSAMKDQWMVASLNSEGGKAWVRSNSNDTSAADSSLRLALDSSDHIYVAGTLQPGDQTNNTSSNGLSLHKYDKDGGVLWKRSSENTGAATLMNAVSVDPSGNAAIGGTEYRSDGTEGIVLSRFDWLGNLINTSRVPQPAGTSSSTLFGIHLDNWQNTRFFGLTCMGNVTDMNVANSIFLATTNPQGNVKNIAIYDVGPHLSNRINDLTSKARDGFAVTGQVAFPNGSRLLSILRY